MILFYFSGTGNSKYIAELFSNKMNINCYSIEIYADFDKLITENDTIAFCYPVYGSRVPRIFREFVTNHMGVLNGKKLIIFCTQLGFSGDGARAFTDMFNKDSVRIVYAEHFNMPNNINNMSIFPISSDKTNATCLAKAKKKMNIVCRNISNGKVIKRGFNLFSRALGLIQGAFMPRVEQSGLDSVQIDDDCNGCGLCVQICPMHNFRLENNIIIPQGNCTLCYRCINKCPQKSISVYICKKVKKQYKGL